MAQSSWKPYNGPSAKTGRGADDEPDYPREPGHLVLARVLIAEDRPGQALSMLAAGSTNPAIAGQPVVTLDTVKSTSRTSWASSARPTAPRPSPGHGNRA
jgi:hypothetical protein